jgi:hypothetical protein
MMNRKFRWVFQGWDSNLQEVFPASFIKINARPPSLPLISLDEHGNIEKTYFPVDFFVTQNFLMMDEVGQARKQYSAIREKIANLNTGKLMLYDGAGTLLESWDLQDITLMSIQTDPENYESNEQFDELVVVWGMTYNKWSYKNHINEMLIHTFPSGLTIDLDRPHISEQYAYEIKQINNHDDLSRFQERWQYLCPSIRKCYDYEEFDKMRKGNLRQYTENYVYPANKGNEWAISYLELHSPNVLSTIKAFALGTHIHDSEQKFKTDGYNGPDEALTFKKMVDAGRINFDKDGFVRLYQPSDPYEVCRTIERYNSHLECETKRKSFLEND